MSDTPFLQPDGDGFLPDPVCAGPWDPRSLHGRIVAGLLAHAIERDHGDPELQPVRLTVDMYRLPGFAPLTVTTRRVRDGRRLRVVDAECFSDGVSVGQASCQLLRRSENPAGNRWSRPDWGAPKPDAIDGEVERPLDGKWITIPISGGMGSLGERRLWMREVRELVAGIPVSPWIRVALAADFASPFANAGESGLGFINSDITLYLHRLPVTEWVGLEVVNHQASSGVAIGECYIYDEEGPIGSSSVGALAQVMQR